MTAELESLIAALESEADAERVAAAEQLARMEADAGAAGLALVKACATESDALRDWVVAALESSGQPPPTDVPALAALLTAECLDTAYWSATLLGRLKADAAAAVPALADALDVHPDLVVRQRAAWALGQIGKAGASARDSLAKAAENSDRRLSTLAREALARL